MPPNYQIFFEEASLTSAITYGGDPMNEARKRICTRIRDIDGTFECGVDYQTLVAVGGSLHRYEAG